MDKNDVRLFIAFKDSDGILKSIAMPELTDEMYAEYVMNYDYPDITVYVWDMNNAPLTDKIIVE